MTHDYLCNKCGGWAEVSFESYELFDQHRTIPCVCGGLARQTWKVSPGLAGVSEPGTRGVDRTFQPGYDIQSGKTFYDRAQRDAYLKKRGLIGLGPEEFKRTLDASKTDLEGDYSGLVPAMKEAYEENESGKITPHLIVDSKTINPVIVKE